MNVQTIYTWLTNFLNDPLTPLIQISNGNTIYIYIGLTILIFLEAGSIWMGWLPGPTTIFLASSMAASPSSQINIGVLFILFFIAATLAWIKKYIQGLNDRMNFHGKIKKDLTVVEKYFRDNEKTALLLGRFIPVVDLFVPILAGQARMKFKTFCLLNLSGTLIWLLAYSLSGYFLGGVTFIAKHFSIMILIVIFLPTVSHYGYEFCLEIKKHHSEREQF